jgi:hypothetical protein
MNNIVEFDGVPSGVYTFTYTQMAIGSCPQSVATMTIEVSTFREAGVGGGAMPQRCEGDNTPVDLTSTIGSEDPGGTWTQVSGASTIDLADSSSVDFGNALPGFYGFRYEQVGEGGCPSDIVQISTVVFAESTAGSSGSLTLCEGENTPVDLYSIISGQSPDIVPTILSSSGVINPTGAIDSIGGGKARFDSPGDRMDMRLPPLIPPGTSDLLFTGTAFGGGVNLTVQPDYDVLLNGFFISFFGPVNVSTNQDGPFSFTVPAGLLRDFEIEQTAGGGYDLDDVRIVLGNWTETTAGSPSGLSLDNPEALDFSGVASGTYEFTYTIPANNFCPASSSTATITISSNVAPSVDAGDPIYLCTPGTPVTIGGAPTATLGTGTMLQYSWDFPALLDDETLANPTATVTENSAFTVTVTDELGCRQTDQTAVILYTANAGPDVGNCDGQGIRIGTPAPGGASSISFNWMPATGLSCTACAQPVATPSAVTTYTLTVTVQLPGGGTCVTTDQVTVTPVSALTPGFAGTDQVICKDQTAMIGVSTELGYTYTWTPGVGLDAYNQGTATVLATEPFLPVIDPITYNLTAVAGNCAFEDQVVITVIEARAGADGCGPRIIGEPDRTPNINETYTWTLISGPDILTGPMNTPQTTVSGASSGTSVYELEVCFDGTCCTDQVEIPPCGCLVEIEPERGGCALFNSGASTRLVASAGDIYSSNPDDFIYSWTPMVGLNTYTGRIVELVDNVPRTYTVTMTSPYDPSFMCTDTITVNDPNFAAPIFMAQDGIFCTGGTVNIGQPTISGYTYNWEGPGGYTSTISNPAVGAVGNYFVTVTDAVTGCVTIDTAVVTLSNPTANAGSDWQVCSGASIVLGRPDPSGGQWTYQWSPTTGLDDPNIAQPTLFATADETFSVTVTDPAAGCSATDEVLVDVEASPALVDTPDESICASQGIQIGPASLQGVQYSWSPTTGLLGCTDCARTFVRPDVTTTYTLTALFPGCSTGVTDEVTVTVNELVVDLGPDLTYCPSDGGVNIGDNAPAGMATYNWFPNSNLDDNTIQNPFSTTPFFRTYTLIATDANGCSDSDQIRVGPVRAVEAGSSVSICLGESRQLGSFSNTGTLSWSPSTDLDDPNSPTPLFTPTSTGSFTYTVTQDVNGCMSTDQVTITVNDAPPIIDLGPDLTLCPTDGVNIGDNAPVGFSSYIWSPNLYLDDNTIQNPLSTAPVGTTYTLTGIDANGCISTDEIMVTPIAPSLEAGMPATICQDESLQLGDAGNSGTLSWSPSSGLDDPSSPAPIFTPASTGSFTYTVTQTTGSCTITDQVTVTVDGVTLGAFDQSVVACAGGCVTIGPAAQPGLVYTWSPTAGLSDPSSSQTLACVSGPTTYTLTVFDPVTGCSQSETVAIAIGGQAPMVTVDPIEVCLGSNGQFMPMVSPAGTYDYTWTPSTGLSDPLIADPLVFGGTVGTQTYELTVLDPSTNCSAVVTVQAEVVDDDDLSITVAPPDIDCVSQQVNVSATVTGNASSQLWRTSGDGVFIPSEMVLNPTYQLGPNDLLQKNFTLTLEAVGASCGTITTSALAVDYSACDVVTVSLRPKVMLQGALLGTNDGLMRDDLRQAGLIPQVEPYTGLGFNHLASGGSESVSNMAVITGDNGVNSIVDWVYVELRDANDPSVVLATRSGLLQRDGDVVGVDGTGALSFSQNRVGSYYVAVRHRNHLGVMTASPVVLDTTGLTVDFSSPVLDVYNNSAVHEGNERADYNGMKALWAGNTAADDKVVFAGQGNDKDPIFNEVDQAAGNFFNLQTYILLGYQQGDVNLDGRSIFAGQDNDVDPIFNNVDGYPANFFKLQTYVLPQQLP